MLRLQRAAMAVMTISMFAACGGAATAPAPAMPRAALDGEAAIDTPAQAPMLGAVSDSDAPTSAELEGLPVAPWSADPVRDDAVPSAVLLAWSQAENRTQCAPLAPTAPGEAEGARARVSELIDGGWAVEYDRRGMPGMNRRGQACARCGRGVFGIAGTRMSPDELATVSDGDAPPATYADGSHIEVEAPVDGETVAAASITVRGQGCVYQVWSFLGEEHVRELVSGLRIVDTRDEPAMASR